MAELSEILGSLKLSTIYWVDDENSSIDDLSPDELLDILITSVRTEHSAPIEKMLAKAPKEWKKELVAIKQEISADEKKSIDERIDRTDTLRATLAKFADAEDDGVGVLKEMVHSLDEALTPPQKAALIGVFEPLAAELGYTWKPLSFTTWLQQQEEILKAHTADTPALILLDMQNTKEQAAIDGRQILKNVCSTENSQKAFRFLVVTNTCGVEQEFDNALKLSKSLEQQGGIHSPLFMMAKSRIARAENPAELHKQFVELLSRLKLSTLNQELTQLASKAIQDATSGAFDRLLKMSMHEFLYAVTKSSQIEGVSELDTLLRLVAIEQRDALMQQVTNSQPLRKALEALRGVNVEIREKELAASTELKSLRSREVYWPSDVVNKLHEPIALGDIFSVQTEEGTEYYMLLGNECDLMLRKDGTRNAISVVMAKFEIAEEKGGLFYELECVCPEAPTMKVLRLTKFKTASVDILDLCWLNLDGECTWSAQAEYDKLNLLQSQKARLEELGTIISDSAKATRFIASSPFSAKATWFPIKFGVRRISRMNTTYAKGILSKLATTMARPSYDHDYTKVRIG